MIFEVKIPQFNVNDENVKLVEWNVEENEYVDQGETLCSIETSKALLELEAEKAGYVKSLMYRKGDSIPIQGVICYIVDKRDIEVAVGAKKVDTTLCRATVKDDIKATDRAKKTAQRLNIDISKISKKGIIREKDIMQFYEATRKDAIKKKQA